MRRWPLVVLVVLLAAVAGCGEDDPAPLSGGTLTVWNHEHQPDRLAATEAILEDFTRSTGVKTEQVPVPEDGLPQMIRRALAEGELPDVVLSTGMPHAHRYVAEGVFDAAAAQEVVDRLGRETFSKRALALVSSDDGAAGVPSDGWGQLLVYRKDLFDQAGLQAPQTLADVVAAARELDRDGMAGIALATAPDDQFTHETFEHIGLAQGCQLVDAAADVTFDSPECVEALRLYAELAQDYSLGGVQDVDSTRAAYFAGRAAMLFWSPFLLDGLAGLSDENRPTCEECRQDPAYLARNSGLVGPLAGSTGEPSQYGSVATFNITVDAPRQEAERLVEYMMSDGYVRWLGLSPQGKYPVRAGDSDDPQKFAKAWAELESGIDRKAPLSDFYSEASIASLGEGVANFQRWGFAQGQGALVGKLAEKQPVSNAVGEVIRGRAPEAAAKDVQAAVEKLKSGR
ncbi:MAG: ABC transporter substrate-binding protein [Solirubrobacteraceae bacterium]